MPGGMAVEPLSKKERARYAKAMAEVVRTLKQMDRRVEKLTKLMEKLVVALGAR